MRKRITVAGAFLLAFGVGCSTLESRRDATLQALSWPGGTDEDLRMKTILSDGIRGVDGRTLSRPILLSARYFQKGTNVTIVADWICKAPIADGLILKFNDGTESRCEFHEMYLKRNLREAAQSILFTATVGTQDHPAIWDALRRKNVDSIVLTTNGVPVSNTVGIHFVRGITEEGQ